MSEKKSRIALLDILRGTVMVYMILYHTTYDLKFLYGREIPALITPGNTFFEYLHTFFLWLLFAVSGICAGFSRNSLKRGVLLYIVGWLITAFTSLFMPSQIIVFGALSCFGACMVLTDLIKPLLNKIPWTALLIISVVLWVIFDKISMPVLDNAAYLYPIGIRSTGFRSADYFPIIPNIFMFWAGFALYRPLTKKGLPERLTRLKSGFLGFLGKHSLIIYAVHQPILMIIFTIIFGG